MCTLFDYLPTWDDAGRQNAQTVWQYKIQFNTSTGMKPSRLFNETSLFRNMALIPFDGPREFTKFSSWTVPLKFQEIPYSGGCSVISFFQ